MAEVADSEESLTFIEVGHAYKAMKPNKILGEMFLKHAAANGLPHTPTKDNAMGSTDMGDVTQVVPGIHPYAKIAEKSVAGHSREFAEASIAAADPSAACSVRWSIRATNSEVDF